MQFSQLMNALSERLNPVLERFFGIQIRRASPRWYSRKLGMTYLKSNPSVIFDVGSNVGKVAIELAKSFPEAKIYSFEPDPMTFVKLKNNSQKYDNIISNRLALSDHTGKASLETTDNSERNRIVSLTHLKDTPSIEVNCETVSSYCRRFGIDRIDILKTDTEGHDFQVLSGCEEFLENLKLIICEVGFQKDQKIWSDFSRIYELMCQNRFEIRGFYDIQYDGSGQLAFANALFVRDSKNPS